MNDVVEKEHIRVDKELIIIDNKELIIIDDNLEEDLQGIFG